MSDDAIVVRGAREHNLRSVDVDLPRNQLIVFTGLSGSGKSSLAFDTIFAEGQRRYVESLSAYARQFIGQLEKPDVDHIEGLSPAIAIDQKGISRNPRSTVGTVTEIYDYLRLLFARVGTPHCPSCGRVVTRQSVQQMVDAVLALPDATRFLVLAPVIRDKRGEHRQVLDDARRSGYARVRIDGTAYRLDEELPTLTKSKRHTIEVVVDRLVASSEQGTRLADSLETALRLGGGNTIVAPVVAEGSTGNDQELLFSEHFACVHCRISLEEIEPRTFSFNSPHGACPDCTGLGTTQEVDPELLIPNPDLSLNDGAIATSLVFRGYLHALATQYGFSLDAPVSTLGEDQRQVLFHGTGKERIPIQAVYRNGTTGRTYQVRFPGIVRELERRYRDTESEQVKSEIERFMFSRPCPTCKGARLKPASLAVKVGGISIAEMTALMVGDLQQFLLSIALEGSRETIARPILRELRSRLDFLANVGLAYLTLDRAAATLSGGEAQRIRLATQIGSQLKGVIYVLDEPSIGLHARDQQRLVTTLLDLRDLGNTVLVVEHDEATMRAADYLVDIGPGAGEHGGEIVAEGPLTAIEEAGQSVTGAFLAGRRRIARPLQRREPTDDKLTIRGVRQNNLKNVDVRVPLGCLVVVSGVSGSGKSTLVNDVLHRALAQLLHRAYARPGTHDAIEGAEHLDKVINIDQAPIGRTPRSNPATYTGLFTPIRELFAATREARVRGYKAGRFSFNVKGGRCEACRGQGTVQIEMQFLPDVYVPCEVCGGSRYNREALEILYLGKTIADVLDLTVAEALGLFANVPRVRKRLETLHDVGMGYIRLGQAATTLSGGEAQRVKLATELSRRATGKTLYILDEPTTGLHFADVERLLDVLQRLVDAGNTVLVIEHHLDVLNSADWIIDLGPDGGDAGGEVIAVGPPEQIAGISTSCTGAYLRSVKGGAVDGAAALGDEPRAAARCGKRAVAKGGKLVQPVQV
ncbi:MAG: excinuclease ABC subunit A [Dehalococcoidia bacterium]|nr:excinuclease ABC subunit A [Dehalococcoidia bacterium]